MGFKQRRHLTESSLYGSLAMAPQCLHTCDSAASCRLKAFRALGHIIMLFPKIMPTYHGRKATHCYEARTIKKFAGGNFGLCWTLKCLLHPSAITILSDTFRCQMVLAVLVLSMSLVLGSCCRLPGAFVVSLPAKNGQSNFEWPSQ